MAGGAAQAGQSGTATASPPARVARAGKTSRAEYGRKRTDPSANSQFAPPGVQAPKMMAVARVIDTTGAELERGAAKADIR